MILRQLFLLLLFYCLISCESSVDQLHDQYSKAALATAPSFTTVYQPVEMPEPIIAKLIANPETGLMKVVVSILNTTEDTLKLTPNDFTLSTEGGGNAHPLNLQNPVTVLPGEQAHTTLHFSPTHSRLFYSLTGMSGDLNKEYSLHINFFEKTETVKWQLPEQIHKTYLVNNGITQKTNIFLPAIDVEKQKDWQIKHEMNEFVFSGDSEVSAAGINMRFQAYQLSDTLYLSVRIVNHSTHDMNIYPKAFFLKYNEQLAAPLELKEIVRLRKSERFIHTFKYLTKELPQGFSLLKESIKVMNIEKEHDLLVSNLKFQMIKYGYE